MWYSRNSGRKPCEIHAPAKNLGCLLRILSSAPCKELKFCHSSLTAFAADLAVNQAHHSQFTLAGCECLLRATGCGQVRPGPFLHSFSIFSRGWHGWMAQPWKILLPPRERWFWAVPKGSQTTLRGKLNNQLGETPWVLQMEGSQNLCFWGVHLRTFPYILILTLGFQPGMCLCAIHSAT